MRQNTFSMYKLSTEKCVSHLYLHSRRNINFVSIHCFTLSCHLLESLQCRHFFVHVHTVGHVIAQAVSCQLLITRAQVQVKACPRGICGGHSGIGTEPLSLNISVFPPSVSSHQCPILIHSSIANNTLYSELTASINDALKGPQLATICTNLQL